MVAPLVRLAMLLCMTVSVGCAFEETALRPGYADARDLLSLCDLGEPLQLRNQGDFLTARGSGRLLLSAQLMRLPAGTHLDLSRIEITHEPGTGLLVRAFGPDAGVYEERLPPEWLLCAEDGLHVTLPQDPFYVWASVGAKRRRFTLQVSAAGDLVLHHDWRETGLAMMLMPVSFDGDGWARFPADAEPFPPPQDAGAPAAIPDTGCRSLDGLYEPRAVSLGTDGSLDDAPSGSIFFPPATASGAAVLPAEGGACGLRIQRVEAGDLEIGLVGDDGSIVLTRLVEDADVSCGDGTWSVVSNRELLSPLALIAGTAGVLRTDLTMQRTVAGDLDVAARFRSRGLVLLIPAGTTSERFFRLESLPGDACLGSVD